MGRSGAASCCAAISPISSASPASSRCRYRAAKPRSGSRGGWRRRICSRPAVRSASSAGRLVRQSLVVNAPLSSGCRTPVRRRRGAARRAASGCQLRGPGRDRARAARRRGAGRRRTPARSRLGSIRAPTSSPPRPTTSTAGRRRRRSPQRSTRASRGAAARLPASRRRAANGDPRGGSFQNLRLLAATRSAHALNWGFRVLDAPECPPNDGGISYGQAGSRGEEDVEQRCA